MTSTKIQPSCRKYNINIGCFDGTRINPRNITQRDTALKRHNNHFRLIWKTNGICYIQETEDEPKSNLKVVDNVLSDKHVRSFTKYEYNPENLNLH